MAGGCGCGIDPGHDRDRAVDLIVLAVRDGAECGHHAARLGINTVIARRTSIGRDSSMGTLNALWWLATGGRHMHLTLAAIAWLVAAPANAGDIRLTHSGRVLDAAGAPVNGTHSLHISLYSDADGTAELWSKDQ